MGNQHARLNVRFATDRSAARAVCQLTIHCISTPEIDILADHRELKK